MAAAGSTDREAEAKSYTFVNLHVHTTADRKHTTAARFGMSGDYSC